MFLTNYFSQIMAQAVYGLLACGAMTVVLTLGIAGQSKLPSDVDTSIRQPMSGTRIQQLAESNLPSIRRSVPSLTDGGLDLTFNAAVTEGNGFVTETALQPDGKIVVVGLFDRANGSRMNGIARFNPDGTLDQTFNSGNGANSTVYTVALQTDGKIIIAGDLTTYNGQPVSRIVRLNSDGSIDGTFVSAISFNGIVRDIAIQPDGKIIVGGQFSTSSTRLVRLNSDGGLDTAFPGFSSVVRAIALAPSGKILVGGDTGLPARAIRRINNDGSEDASFTPGTGPNSTVLRLALLPDGRIVASGVFQSYNGSATDGIVRINENGTLDTAFDHITSSTANNIEAGALALQPDGRIILGYYYHDNAGDYARIVRFSTDGSVDATFAQGDLDIFSAFDARILANGKIVVGGFFVEYNDQTHLRLAQLNGDGSIDAGFAGWVSYSAAVLKTEVFADGKILICGDFDFVNGARTRGGIARLNPDGTLDHTFQLAPGIYGDMYTFLVQGDGRILIGSSHYVLARLNADGSLDSSFVPSFSNGYFAFPIRTIGRQSDGKILVGGSVLGPNGTATLVRFNLDGIMDTSFNSIRANGQVLSMMVQPDDKIIIGGTFFPQFPDFPRNGIARLNSDGTLNNGFTSGAGRVEALDLQPDGKVVAAGFTLRRYTSSDGTFDPSLDAGTGFDSVARSVEVQPDGRILLGGFFTSYNGNAVSRIFRVDSDGGIDSNFNVGSGPSGPIFAIARQSDGKILAGGLFLDFNGQERFSLVRLQNSAIPSRTLFDYDGDGKSDVSVFRPSTGLWYLLRSTAGYTGMQWGEGTDKITPADYDGDGKTDVAVFRASNSTWYIFNSATQTFSTENWGQTGDLAVPADYDGDGKADVSVYRPSDANWYRKLSGGGFSFVNFGTAEDKPVPSDWDGDGKADIGVFRPSSGVWYFLRTNAGFTGIQWGVGTDIQAPGDYDGDGKTDVAVFRPENGTWYLGMSTLGFASVTWGQAGDVPSAGDFDGDGKTDIAVFRPSNGHWYILNSTAGIADYHFGESGDQPTESAYRF